MTLDSNTLAIVPYVAQTVDPNPPAQDPQQLQVVIHQPSAQDNRPDEGTSPRRAFRPANPRRYLNITTAALSLGPAIYWYTRNPFLSSAAIMTLLAGFYLGNQCPEGIRGVAVTVIRGSIDNTLSLAEGTRYTLRGMATAAIIGLRQINRRNIQRLATITRFSVNIIRHLLRPNIVLAATTVGSGFMLRNLYNNVMEMIRSLDLQSLLELDVSERELMAIGALAFSFVAFYAYNFSHGRTFVDRQRTQFEQAVELRLDRVEHALNIPLATPRAGQEGELPMYNPRLDNLERMFERGLDEPMPQLAPDHGILFRTSRVALYSIFRISTFLAIRAARSTVGAVRLTARTIRRGSDTLQAVASHAVRGVGVVTAGAGLLATAAIGLTAALIALPFVGTAAAGYYHPKVVGTLVLAMAFYFMVLNHIPDAHSEPR